ncbi:MAG: hypothetical protein H6739_35770 [Alphaproteobacteria bacterium]|nr:hypothetical protein [Alphaproteobacteria bacterium]
MPDTPTPPGPVDALGRLLIEVGVSRQAAPLILDGESLDGPGVHDRTLALVATDPLGIQELIQASRRPLTTLGASTTLTDWDRALRHESTRFVDLGDLPQRTPWVPLYAGGGQGLLLTRAQDADALVQSLKEQFTEKVHGTLGAAWLKVSPQELAQGPKEKGFGALLRAVGVALGRERDGYGPPVKVWNGPRCDECGVRPVAEGKVCKPCHGFAKIGQEVRGEWGIDPEHASISDLAESHVAVLALDGTRVGKHLRGQETLRDYIHASHALLEAFSSDTVRRALHIGPDGLRALPVMLGGDDVQLVFDARNSEGAPALALQLINAIERELDTHRLPIGVGAGLVISRHLGFQEAVGLARQLVVTAKAAARQADQRSGFDFEVVHGGAVLSESVARLRQDRVGTLALTVGGSLRTRTFRHGLRPLTLDEAEALVALARSLHLRELHQLRHIAADLQEDPLVGLITASDLTGRARTRGERPLLERLRAPEPPWAPREVPPDGWLLREREERALDKVSTVWATALPELITLADWTGGAA